MITRILASGILALLPFTVYANDNAAITLPDLKAKCFDLKGNDQLRPFKVEVTCREVGYVWRQIAPGKFQLQNVREVGASFLMKTYNVPYEAGLVPTASTEAECTRYERLKYTVPAVTVDVGCEALEAINDLAAFCAPHIQARLGKDSGAQQWEPTGEIRSTCPSSK